MRWILVDVLLALLALGLLVVVGLSVWRRVQALGREVSRAGELVAEASTRLERAQAGASRPAGGMPRPGVRSPLSS